MDEAGESESQESQDGEESAEENSDETGEAERSGLVSRIVPADQLIDEAVKTAETIASMSLPIVMMAKESVNRAYETSLSEGVRFERRLFHSMFATEDQTEGMAAFAEKRKAEFKNK